MAKISDLYVTVRVSPSEEDVKRCLKIIEWWLNDNPDMTIKGGWRDENGRVDELKIVKKQ